MYKVLVISFLLVFNALFASAQTDWKLASETDGIKIYTSIVPGSKVKAIKVECEFNATASQFTSVILDVNHSAEWVYHTKSSILIKQVSSSELYYYSEVCLPWPAENRDFVAHLKVTQNPDTKVVTIDGPIANNIVPVKSNVVRITDSNGKWVITPMGNNHINVEYSLHADPGGDLPAWIINMFAAEGPKQIFKNLKLQLQKPAYRSSMVASISN